MTEGYTEYVIVHHIKTNVIFSCIAFDLIVKSRNAIRGLICGNIVAPGHWRIVWLCTRENGTSQATHALRTTSYSVHRVNFSQKVALPAAWEVLMRESHNLFERSLLVLKLIIRDGRVSVNNYPYVSSRPMTKLARLSTSFHPDRLINFSPRTRRKIVKMALGH